MDISKLTIGGTEHTLKDAVARGEETEGENSISAIEIDGTVYDVKDIVARGEGSGTSVEISKIEVGGKVCQIKDVVARETVKYFAVYSADDDSLTFYGDKTVPDEGTQYGGKTVTTVYTDFLDMGENVPPWFSSRTTFKSVMFDESFADARPTSCFCWFDYFSNCTAIDVKYLNTSAVTNISAMFCGCTGLTALDVSNFDTSSVTDMNYMFYGCTGLTALDVSGFDTSSVTYMSYMFYGCTKLITIYSDDDKFVTTAVRASAYMFNRCTALVGGNGTKYDSSKTDYTMAHIDTPDNPGYFTAK